MRFDLQLIPQWISKQARVLDLGCGDGSLLQKLARENGCDGLGIEIDPNSITDCIARGIPVVEQDLNKGLSNFQDNSFDIVVMAHALQTLRSPHLVIDEMLRVGKECIVTFPNFAHWSCRIHLIQNGRMPVSRFMPFQWYNTPNIHFCTIKDFEDLCREKQVRVLDRAYVGHDSSETWLGQLMPNLFGVTAVYHISR